MGLPKALADYSALIGFPGSKTMERILEMLFGTDDEKRIAESLPGTIGDIVSKTGFSLLQAETALKELVRKGAVAQKLTEAGQYRLLPAMIELRDSTVLCPDAPQELFELWDRIISSELEQLIPLARSMKFDPLTRVLPIEKSIKSQDTVLDVDSARKIFEDADLITVIPCACRTQAQRVGKRDSNCPAPKDSVCMQTNRFAEITLKRGVGKQIDKSEALRRLEAAEEAGLVHLVRNNVKKDMFMCNCCACCCVGLHTLIRQYQYIEGIAKSRFSAMINESVCTACGVCADRCLFGAISVDTVASVNPDLCFGCGNCVAVCPEEAFELVEARPVECIRVK